jgi:hypothetical protein
MKLEKGYKRVKYLQKTGLVLSIALAGQLAHAEEACATSTANGGLTSITLSENFSPSEWGAENSWRAIAEQVQEDFGNSLAHDTATGMIYIVFNVTVAGFPAPMPPLYVSFTGEKSIEKEILDARGIDTDVADPTPCDPSKNNTNNETTNDSNTSNGGGGGGSFGGLWGSNDLNNWLSGFRTVCGRVNGGSLQCATFPVSTT